MSGVSVQVDQRVLQSAPVDLAPQLENCFWFDEVEASYDLSGVSGHLPGWLRGTWFVNGPARFELGGKRYRHWLDGDGMVCALRLADDGIRFTNRFVRTRKWRDETEAGRFLYRAFGTAFPEDRLRRNVMLEPPVNVSVYPYFGRLLAFGEQTLPYELDFVTLETRGEYDFGSKLNEVTPFSAHAKFDGALLNFGIAFSASSPMLNVYECDPGGRLVRRRYPLRHQYSLHDFGFTPNHVQFFLSPLLMKFERFWQERISVMESLSWEPELGSRILVVPRTGNSDGAFTVEVGAGYCLHVINCFERGSSLTMDVLLLDAPVYPEYQPLPDLFATVPRARPFRYNIDLESRALAGATSMDYAQSPDFPTIDPARAGRAYSDFWMLGISRAGMRGRKFFDQLAHGSWEAGGVHDVYQTPPGEYLCSEPAFVSSPHNPDEAVVICQHCMPARRASAIVIFDAYAVRSGPLASLPLRHPVHPVFHSSLAGVRI